MQHILLFTLLIGLGCSSYDEHLSQETVEAAISSRCMLRRLYDKFKSDHGLIRSKHEHPHRLTLFEKTLKRIQQLKKNSEITWRVGFTPLSDLTDDEIQTKYHGSVNITGRDDTVNLSVTPSLKAAKVPESFDWRSPDSHHEIGFVTGVQKQQEGSCWARAAVVPLEALMKKLGGNLIQLSVFEIYDCTYDGNNGYNGQLGGGHPIDAWKWLQRSGRLTSREWIPDRPGAKPTHFMKYVYDNTPNYFQGFKLETINKVKYEKQLISAVYENSPVAVGFFMRGLDLDVYKGGSYYSVTCKEGDYHSMAVVGYTQKTLIIKNSWGLQWGEKGYLTWERYHYGRNCGLYEDAYYPTLTLENDIWSKGEKKMKKAL